MMDRKEFEELKERVKALELNRQDIASVNYYKQQAIEESLVTILNGILLYLKGDNPSALADTLKTIEGFHENAARICPKDSPMRTGFLDGYTKVLDAFRDKLLMFRELS